MKTARSKSPKQALAPLSATPLRDVFNAIQAEMKRAAEQLGFDTSTEQWVELLREESMGYPDSELNEDCVRLLPKRSRARLRCLELVGYLAELIEGFEFEDGIDEFDQAFAELEAKLAADPAPMPCNVYVRQLDKEVA